MSGRRLSFIDCSVDQIQQAITTEWMDWKFNHDFWNTILTGEAAPEFRLVGNRTLEFWIRAYNRWQLLGRRLKSKAPGKVDGVELEQILNFPRHRLKDICKLFDQQGWKRLETEGMSGPALGKIRIPVVSLFTAGLLLSQLIAPKDKLRFIFGLADQDDSHTLDEMQFVNFITAFVRGLGSAFGIVNKESAMPSLEVIRELGRRLYDRISVIAADRLKSMSMNSDETRAMLIQAIKDRQAKLSRAATLEVDEVEGLGPKYGEENVPLRQVLNYRTVEAWCFREFKDPLALPYALAIERFCSRGSGAELYHLKSEEWFLSHTTEVEVPQEELDSSRDVKLPDRWQVLFMRDIWQLCIEEGSFQLSFSECEYGLKRSLTLDLWELVVEAMHKCVGGGNPSFLQFLKKAFPGAQPKHLSTFEGWCHQYDDLQKRSAEMDLLTEAAEIFAKKNAMPVLPQDDQARLEKEFEEMDVDGTGCVPIFTIEQRWGWDTETSRNIIAKWDLSEDGCLDKGDFLRMMCPDGYRLPSMQGEDRDVFGMLLTGSIRYLSDAISTVEELFAVTDRRTSRSGRKIKPMPFSLLAEIPDAMWTYWNDLFTRLDADEDDHVTERDLLREGLLSQEVARRLMSIIDPEHPESFTRRGFLTACLKASNMRRAKFECGR